MEIWYQTSESTWGEKVVPVQVERSTERTVTIKGRRRNRQGSYYCYFPTAGEAWDWLEQRMSAKVEHAKTTLQRYRSELGQIQSERKAASI